MSVSPLSAFSSPTWMKPQITGGSRWSAWRSKMWSCQCSCREPWLQRQRLHERPELRSGSVTQQTLTRSAWFSHDHFKPPLFAFPECVCVCDLSLHPHTGDCSRGWNECISCPEGGVSRDCGVSLSPAASLPPDSHHHCRGEELHHYLPAAHGRYVSLHEEVRLLAQMHTCLKANKTKGRTAACLLFSKCNHRTALFA